MATHKGIKVYKDKDYSKAASRKLKAKNLNLEGQKDIQAPVNEGPPVGTVQTRMQRAKKKLPGNMGKETVH